ncbi:MAG: helix-turn-helix domain-containing protein [Fimbriimonadales bacterium]|nr:helix-turn-helix domain-containing protein [Fimbriimonadales bacterium]
MSSVAETELAQVVQQGEGETCEFRTSFGDEALRTLCAFANTRGGVLWIGVNDNGAILGIALGRETLRDWANQIRQTLGINASLDALQVGEKTIVRIEVAESQAKPVRFKGRSWKRAGSTDQQASEEDETRWVLERTGHSWDALPAPYARWDDLNLEHIARFRRLCNLQGRRPIPEDEDDAVVLRKLGLITPDGRLTRAAVLLFGVEPQQYHLNAVVKVGRFRSPTLIVDDRAIRGTLFEQVEAVMQYFRDRLETRYEFKGDPAREVVWEYPLEALREAIINAICHRDYLEAAHIQVRWYDDRLVFYNPGKLPPPLTIEDLAREHISQPRNRLIAEAFYYIGWIEQWGTGIRRMREACQKMGLPEPSFQERAGIWLTFRKDRWTEESLQELGLNERQIRAVNYVRQHMSITNSEYQRINAVSARTASRELADLVQRGILEQVGATGKGTRYVLKTPNAP